MEEWAKANNLKLNCKKTKEMIVLRKGITSDQKKNIPTQLKDIERVASMKILGVYFDEALSFRCHLSKVLSGSASSLYAIKILRSKGLSGPALWDVATQTAVSRMLYASPAWWGFMDSTSQRRLNSVIARMKRLSCLPATHSSFDELCNLADQNLFDDILNNNQHVLHHIFPLKSNVNMISEVVIMIGNYHAQNIVNRKTLF
jgi:hypothetical protein